jgi:hypothetical protein
MDIANWLNRETIQLALIFVVTMGFHFYFISTRIGEAASSASNEPIIEAQQQSHSE